MQDRQDRVVEWLGENKWPLVVAGVSLAVMGVGVWWSRPAVEKVVDKSGAVELVGKPVEVVVEVSGEVYKPGVYKLASGARVEEAMKMAGGLADTADKDWVAKYVNLAARLSDGQKIYIPARQNPKSEILNPKLEGKTTVVNINTAGQAELEALAGIGPATAKKIMAGRPYQRVEELVEKKILAGKTYDSLKEQLTVW